MLAVAYDAMLRRAELVALEVVDVAMDRGGSASLLIRRAKNDPEGGGAVLYLHRDSVRLLKEWLGRERDRLRFALPIGAKGRRRRRKAGRQPGAQDLPGRWPERAGLAPKDRAADLRAQPPGRSGPGHDRFGRRDRRDHAGRDAGKAPAWCSATASGCSLKRNGAAQLARLQKRR